MLFRRQEVRSTCVSGVKDYTLCVHQQRKRRTDYRRGWKLTPLAPLIRGALSNRIYVYTEKWAAHLLTEVFLLFAVDVWSLYSRISMWNIVPVVPSCGKVTLCVLPPLFESQTTWGRFVDAWLVAPLRPIQWFIKPLIALAAVLLQSSSSLKHCYCLLPLHGYVCFLFFSMFFSRWDLLSGMRWCQRLCGVER